MRNVGTLRSFFCNLHFQTPTVDLERGWGLWLKVPVRRGGERWLREEGETYSER